MAVGDARWDTELIWMAPGTAGGVQQECDEEDGPLPAALEAETRKKYSVLGLRFLISWLSFNPVYI